MTERPRRPKTVNEPPTPISQAIDAAEAKRRRPLVGDLHLQAFAEPMRLNVGERLNIEPPADPDKTIILVRDGRVGVWRAILLEPGAEWILHAPGGRKPEAGLVVPRLVVPS